MQGSEGGEAEGGEAGRDFGRSIPCISLLVTFGGLVP